MRIGIDGQPLSEIWTGVGHYTFELACALARLDSASEFELISPRPFLFSDDNSANENQEPSSSVQQSRDVESLPSNLHLVQPKTNLITRRWFAFGLPRYLARHNVALFHGTNYEIPFVTRRPTVLTIHDLSLFTHAQTHLNKRVRRARARLPFLARQATRITTETETMRDSICESLNVSRGKVIVIPAAPRRVFRPLTSQETLPLRKRFDIGERFLLYVGTIEPRKNLTTLVRAFEEVVRQQAAHEKSNEPPLQLVIAGARGWLTDEFFARVETSNIKNRLRLTGYVSDENLCALYASCAAFVYPSLNEGFGLPPLEAMRCGAPVISSDIAVLRETLQNAAMFFPPTDVNALAEKICRLLDDKTARTELAQIGERHTAHFSWDRTAHLTREVYDSIL